MEREIRQVLVRAGVWARARAKCRRLADSKSAKASDLYKAQRALGKAGDQLEEAVSALESALQKRTVRGKRRRVDWNAIFGVVGVVAGHVESALRKQSNVIMGRVAPLDVIDTTAEEE